MGLLDRVAAQVGMPAPRPRLRVVAEDEPPEPVTRTARPEALDTFIGQQSTTFNLSVECAAAEMDGRLPDHTLLSGPPGLGKTSLAKAIAARLGVRYVEIPATALDRVSDVASALAQIGEVGDEPCVIFVDEVHAICKKGATLLLSALEDRFFQPSGCERIDLAEFVMIAATTNPGQLSKPLRARFGIHEVLDYYDQDDLERIVTRYAENQGVEIGEGVASLVASVGRGTPRTATALLRRVAVYGRVGGVEVISVEDAQEALDRLGVDALGLDKQDRALLGALSGQSTPVGMASLAAQLGVDEDALVSREPYLLRSGWLRRTSRGRTLTRSGYKALNMRAPVWTPQ